MFELNKTFRVQQQQCACKYENKKKVQCPGVEIAQGCDCWMSKTRTLTASFSGTQLGFYCVHLSLSLVF